MNFGNVELTKSGGRWVITCEPHVRARLKRVFARAPKTVGDTVGISDTPENCRDLLWFLERYPMTVAEEKYLKRQSELHEEMITRLDDLLNARHPPTDIKMAVPARDYQLIAAHALSIRHGILLADEVGLGKSASSICAMMDPDNLPALVVAPTHLVKQWARYLSVFAPGLRTHVVRNGRPYPLIGKPGGRTQDLWPDRLPDVIVTNYHKLRGWAETLGGLCRYVVYDECQQLRNQGSNIYDACKHVGDKARLRMGLSATPIYNYGGEFFWVVDAILPGALGEHDEFIREWCDTRYGEKPRLKDSEQFGIYLRREGIMLRRTRKELKRELPAVTKIMHAIDADREVLDSVTGDAIALAKVILAHNEEFRGQKMRAAGEFDMLMRQATGIAKAPYVAEFVRLLVENGERVLLFGWHREVYGIWNEKLKDLNPVMFTGSESPVQKEKSKQAFIRGESNVLIMSLRASEGLDDLQTCCRTVVFGELDWSPGIHEQGIGRINRDGQKNPVMAYYLLSNDGSDPIVGDVLGVKKEQIDGVRNPGEALIERIDTGENNIRKLAEDFLKSRILYHDTRAA